MKRQKIAPELKEQIINRIKNDGVTVAQAALDHGIGEDTIYTWIAKKADGGLLRIYMTKSIKNFKSKCNYLKLKCQSIAKLITTIKPLQLRSFL